MLAYYVDATHDKVGTVFARVTMDPMNKVYAGWMSTIAGDERARLWSNNAERLVETWFKLL